jgi:hypothetical protein
MVTLLAIASECTHDLPSSYYNAHPIEAHIELVVPTGSYHASLTPSLSAIEFDDFLGEAKSYY